MDQDVKQRFDEIDGKLQKILKKLESLESMEGMNGFDAIAADQVTGTGAKLDEILELLQNRH